MKIFRFVFLLIVLPCVLLATSWDVSGDGTTATTTPSPYDNNSDISTTLSIAGATALRIDITGKTEYWYDKLYVTDENGNQRIFYGTINESYIVSGSNISIRFTSDFITTDSGVTISVSSIESPSVCPGTTINNLENTSVSATDSASNVTVPSYTTYYYHFTPAAAGTIQVNSSANKTYNSLYISDGCGSALWSDTSYSTSKSSPEIDVNAGQQIVIAFYRRYGTDIEVDLDFTYTVPIATAIDDSYTTIPNVQLVVDAASGLLANDKGLDITITDINSTELQGTIDSYDPNTGEFTYTPPSSFTGVTSFSYTIQDTFGNTSTATVSITVAMETDFDSNEEFVLINPQSTRNIIGDYKIAGNTVLCLTTRTSTFATSESECVDTTNMTEDATSNNYIAKFIDIDSDSSTWNSSSSFITLPDSYKQVLWAGLFWQGRFAQSTRDIHYGRSDGSGGFEWVDIGDYASDRFNESFLQNEAQVQNILLKVDNSSYQPVQASKVHYSEWSDGITYSARADVTHILRNTSLAAGNKVNFTVGNLPTSEGREDTPGIFGGWALVVIYAEDIIVGKPRSIVVHGGMLTVSGNLPDKFVDVTGFKLPSSGSSVTASLSMFSGEGEFDYSPDGLQVSSNTDPSWRDMPGATDPNNIFDAVMDGIDRDDIPNHMNNLQNNNVGVEVDNYDLSSIVSGYDRENTDTISLKMYSNQDYIIPGMLVFSTELYQPNICYDYTLEVGGNVIPSENNEINTTIGSYTTEPLITRISIQSKEGDFDFNDVNLTYQLEDTANINYMTGTTMIADDGENFYTASTQTINETTDGFLIYLGDGATPNSGGTIKPYQKRFIKFKNSINDRVKTKFGLLFQTTVDYGSGPVPIANILTQEDICKDVRGYYIGSNIFNVVSTNADTLTGRPYNLYTQIVGRPFSAKVFSHDIDYINSDHRLKAADTAVEVEVFNADYYPRDANLSCVMPDSNISSSVFVDFNNQSSADLNSFSIDRAVRNAGFRVWYLGKPDGSVAQHHCTDASQQSCFNTLYNSEFKSFETSERNCTIACNSSSGCYECIKGYYGVPVCSKDNFSVRPEAFVVEISDNNQTEDSLALKNIIANSSGTNNPADGNVSASYNYRLDINVTDHYSNMGVKGYYRTIDNNNSYGVSMAIFADPSNPNCNDVSDRNFTVTLYNGSNVNNKYNKNMLIKIDQIGEYNYILKDSNWTAVDWDSNLSTHHLGDGFEENDPDCLIDSDTVPSTGKPGCDISSSHINSATGVEYKNLGIRMFPYDFVLSLGYSSPVVDDRNVSFVYHNTLDSTKDYPFGFQNTDDKNMSYNIQGEIYAAGWHAAGGTGIKLTNFVDGCYSEDVVMGLRHQYLYPDVPPIDEANLTADLYDYRSSDNSEIHRGQTTFYDSYTANTTTQSDLTQRSSYFVKELNGSVVMDLGYNFDRNISRSINPRRIWIEDFNVTMASQPATLFVDGKSNHKIETVKRVDQNVTFAYARVKPSMEFYDNILKDSILTPISVVVYCDLGFALCQERGVDVNSGQTNEPYWWLSTGHNNIAPQRDGNIALTTNSSGAINPDPLLVGIDNNGTNLDINVTYTGSSRPHIEYVRLLTFDDDPVSYTDRWLIYNESNDTRPTNPFYRVKFIGGSGWAGHGDTGNVVKTNDSGRKNKRLSW